MAELGNQNANRIQTEFASVTEAAIMPEHGKRFRASIHGVRIYSDDARKCAKLADIELIKQGKEPINGTLKRLK